jgi:hypothetical protein
MPNSPIAGSEKDTIDIDLRNPLMAGFLAWLLPGLGHYYQRRYHKALIFFLCIVPTFVAGCALASSSEVGIARNVYFYFRIDKFTWRGYDFPCLSYDSQFWWLVQAPLGIAAIPSWFQASQINSGQAPIFGKFMVPPRLGAEVRSGMPPDIAKIRQEMPHYELGTYLTVIAGLMNLLVIFDAIDGPFIGKREEKNEK